MEKTLVSKYKVCTINNLFKKFNINLKQLDIKNEYQQIIAWYNKRSKSLVCINSTEILKNVTTIYETFWKKINKIQANSIWWDLKLDIDCVLCGNITSLEQHHIKSVKKLKHKIKRLRPNWYNYKNLIYNLQGFINVIHVVQNQKQVAICTICYTKLHNRTLEKDTYNVFIKKVNG